jgi:hypothetical protein
LTFSAITTSYTKSKGQKFFGSFFQKRTFFFSCQLPRTLTCAAVQERFDHDDRKDHEAEHHAEEFAAITRHCFFVPTPS